MKRTTQILLAAIAMTVTVPAVAAPYVFIEQVIGISEKINAQMTFVAEAHGVDDWQIGGTAGDCEDFALTKRAELISAGMDPSRVKILVLRNSKGGHAVLSVDVNRMSYVFEWFNTAQPIALKSYLRANRFEIICEARDLSAGNKPASARC